MAASIVEMDERRIAQGFGELRNAREIGAIADQHMLRAHAEHDLAPGKSGRDGIGQRMLAGPAARNRRALPFNSTVPSRKFMVGVPKKPATKRVAGRL